MKSLNLAFLAIALLAAVGCQKPADTAASTEAPATTKSATAGEPVAFRNAEGKLLCPVMGTVINSEKEAVAHQDFEGKRYYMCCAACTGKFKAEPAKYAKK